MRAARHGVPARLHHETPVGRDHSEVRAAAVEQIVGGAAKLARLHARQTQRRHPEPAEFPHVLRGAAAHLRLRQLTAQRRHLSVQVAQLPLQAREALREARRVRVERQREVRERRELLTDVRGGRLAREGLHAPHARREALLRDDHEGADLARALHVRAAAQLTARHDVILEGHAALHAHDAHRVAVLLPEQRHRAGRAGLVEAHVRVRHGEVRLHPAVHEALHLADLLGRQGGAVREVEAQPIRGHQRARLTHARAQHRAQRGVQQVRGRVVPLRREALREVHDAAHRRADRQLALLDGEVVQEETLRALAGVTDEAAPALPLQPAAIADLAAALRVEGRPVEDHLRRAARREPRQRLSALHDGQHAALRHEVLVPDEVRRAVRPRDLVEGLLHVPEQLALAVLAARARPLLLLLQRPVEARLVHADAVLLRDLPREVQREAVRVVQREGLRAGQHLALLDLREDRLQAGRAALQRRQEARLLRADRGLHLRLTLAQLGVRAAHALHHEPHEGVQHRLAQAQQVRVTARAAQDLADHVAAPRVAERHAVRDRHADAAHVLRDDAVRQARHALVGLPGELRDTRHERQEHVVGVEVRDVLQHARDALQPHARVDVLVRQVREDPAVLTVVLREHEVPDLQEARRLARLLIVGPGVAAEVRAAIVEDLRARAARTVGTLGGRVGGPEVLVRVEAQDALLGQAALPRPDVEGLLIVLVDRDVQLRGVQREPLGARQELPREEDRVTLEVVAEAEIAQHLQQAAVPQRPADVLDVVHAQALLRRRDALSLALVPGEARGGPEELRLEGLHARHGEQRGRVGRDQAVRGQAQVPLALEEGQVLLADLGGGEGGRHSASIPGVRPGLRSARGSRAARRSAGTWARAPAGAARPAGPAGPHLRRRGRPRRSRPA